MTILNFQCPGVTRITIPTRISLQYRHYKCRFLCASKCQYWTFRRNCAKTPKVNVKQVKIWEQFFFFKYKNTKIQCIVYLCDLWKEPKCEASKLSIEACSNVQIPDCPTPNSIHIYIKLCPVMFVFCHTNLGRKKKKEKNMWLKLKKKNIHKPNIAVSLKFSHLVFFLS